MNVLEGPRRERRHVLVGGSPCWGTLVDEGQLQLDDGRTLAVDGLTHLPPCSPTKIICPHLTYSSRGIESRDNPQPTPTPTYFMKPVTALNAHGGEVTRPEDCRYLNYEGEFAAVIGRVTRNVTADEAWDHIAGFVPVLDMGVHDFRDTDAGSMLRVKGADGLCPVGPGIVAGVDPRKQRLRTFRNGECVQDAQIGEELIWGPDYMIADLARHITLLPGDLILTGTPCHSRPLNPGDELTLEISELGRLSVTIATTPAPRADVGHPPMDTPEARRVAFGQDVRVPDALKEAYLRAGPLEEQG
jgi:5-oxopent-3-ene-1,2,5-tricarboxylate decarboxylase/2-hydroxyhepta-2,4-diene-1,7-dioate isomerase